MSSAETQANHEDFLVAETQSFQAAVENQAFDEEDIEEDIDGDSEFDAEFDAGCVSLIYKVEMEDKKGPDSLTVFDSINYTRLIFKKSKSI